jgi:hypothetical protein
VIYRMGVPCFSGQLADREATDKLALDRRETRQDLAATPFLFRKCCVCVSWSRYMAVAMHYGPPECVDLPKPQSVDGITEDSETNSSHHASTVTTQMTTRQSVDSLQEQEVEGAGEIKSKSHEETVAIGEEIATSADNIDCKDITDKPIYLSDDASTEVEASRNTAGEADETGQPLSKQSSFAEITELGIAWVDKMKQDIQNNNKKKMRSDPQEGILHLDRPILLCQEIYDKLIGNHQTSKISKDRAIEYLRQDIEEHINDVGFDPFLAGQDEIVAQIESLKKAEEAAAARTRDRASNGDSSVQEKKIETDLAELKTEDRNEKAKTEGNDAESAHNLQPSNPVEAIAADLPSEGDEKYPGAASTIQRLNPPAPNLRVASLPSSPATNDYNINEGEDPSALERESLIGYWNWQNTWKIHQVKMHLAQGSDLALHVCLAIIVNQVRYERNAIAMTV